MRNEPINLCVTLARHPHGSSVILNGVDISGIVRAITISGAVDSVAKATIEIIPHEINIKVPHLHDLVFDPPLELGPTSDPASASDHPPDVFPTPAPSTSGTSDASSKWSE